MNILTLLTAFKEMERLTRTKSEEDKVKMPEPACKKLIEREEKDRKQAADTLSALIETMKKEHGAQGVDYLKQSLPGFGLSHLLDDAPAIDAPLYHGASDYTEIYQHAIYNNLLPLCKLACLYEKNGVAEEHAFKLAIIFTTEQNAIDYILNFTTYNCINQDYFLYNACLFRLPPTEGCNLTYWKKRANQRQPGSRELWMLNPRFQELLPHAPAIERCIEAGQSHGIELDRKAINDKKKVLIKKNTEYKKLSKEKPQTLEQKARRQAGLNDLNQERLQLKIDLTELCSGISLQAADNIILGAFYAKYKVQSTPAYKVLVKYGINQQNIALFYSLKRENDDNVIPNVTIKGEDIGYPGYYLTKLDTLDDKGAAIAACLGKITPCCQHLGGAGHACAVHGITSKNGGFYLLQQGDGDNPRLDDETIASSWAWRGKSEGLCLDSIETARGADTNLIADMFRYFGHQLCHNPDSQKYNLSRITTRASSGVTRKVGLGKYRIPAEQPKDYQGYRDSKFQLLLARSAMPYLFWGNKTLDKYIKNDMDGFFTRLLSRDDSLTENEPLKQAIAFSLQTDNLQLLHLMKNKAAECGKNHEIKALIDVNRQFLKKMEQHPDLGLLLLLEKGAYLWATNARGRSVFHLVARKAVLLKTILGLLPEKKELEALKLADKDGRTVLHKAATHPESLKIILESLPEYEWLEAVKLADLESRTVLHKAATHPESLAFILESLPENERLEALKLADEDGQTALHDAATHPDSLKIILEILLKDERLEAVIRVNNYGNTVLHEAAAHPESLNIILKSLPETERMEAVKLTDKFGNTALHDAATHTDSLKIIFELLAKDERLEAVKLADKDGHTALHDAATHPESFKIILALYPEKERLEALKLADKDGGTVLHDAVTYPESLLKIILELLNQDQIFNFLQPLTHNPRMREQISPDRLPEIQDSFAIDYLKILYTITTTASQKETHTKAHISHSGFPFFTPDTEDKVKHKFEQAILKASSLDDVKTDVYDFLSTYSKSNLARQLRNALNLGDNQEDTLKHLRERWDLPDNPECTII